MELCVLPHAAPLPHQDGRAGGFGHVSKVSIPYSRHVVGKVCRVHIVLCAVPVDVRREDELARVGKLHRMCRLRDQVFAPPAEVVRGRRSALPIIVRHALNQNEPPRAVAQHVVAQASGGEAPVRPGTAKPPSRAVRLVEQIGTNNVWRRAVPRCENLPGFPDWSLFVGGALASAVRVTPQPLVAIYLERVHVQHHKDACLLQPDDQVVENV